MRTYWFFLLVFALALATPLSVFGSSGWKKVAVTKQKDCWYVSQTLSFSSKGSVQTARALLKFVPGKESIIAQDVKKGLVSDGIDADKFGYFTESVEVDCRKKLFVISRIGFFDPEDNVIFEQIFSEPKRHISTPGSAFEVIYRDLCLNKPGFIDTIKDTLKHKKPFLYFYPQGETAK